MTTLRKFSFYFHCGQSFTGCPISTESFLPAILKFKTGATTYKYFAVVASGVMIQ